ncbi:MAG: SPOR domain-containing protein [Mariprofundaceae bacterium]
MVAAMLMNPSSFTLRILTTLLAAPFLMIGSMNVDAAGQCASWGKKLKKEQYIILEREKELSLKTKKEQAKFSDQEELERLIERHHASIEAFNLKLDDFNRTCKKSRSATGKAKPVIRSVKQKKPQQKRNIQKSSGVMPEIEVAASKKRIKTLKGYYIQIAAFKHRAIADDNQKNLENNGFETLMITRPYVYALWVGPYEDRREAKAAKATLVNDFKMDGYLIRFK